MPQPLARLLCLAVVLVIGAGTAWAQSCATGPTPAAPPAFLAPPAAPAFKAPAAPSSSGDTSLASGLVSYWKLDDGSGASAADSVGSNTGTWNGTLGSQWTTGKINGGGNFNGTDNYVDAGNTASLNFGTNSTTISVWFYLIATDGVNGAAGYRSLISKRTNLNYTGWAVFRKANSNQIGAEWASSNGGPYYDPNPGTAILNSWNHVAVVVDRINNIIREYLNGVQTGVDINIAALGNVTNNGVNLSIGKETGISDWNSKIDEVAIWNRALSAGEVQTLYHAGTGNPYGNSTCGFSY